jgi:hypothetical protein
VNFRFKRKITPPPLPRVGAFRRRFLFLLLAASLLPGCVAIRAPLVTDAQFPRAWGEPKALGPECRNIEGRYDDAGSMTGTEGNLRPVSLLAVLGYPGAAGTVSLATHTRKVDRNGDAFITLRITPDDDAAAVHERQGCFCIRQVLVCTQIDEQYRAIAGLGVEGSQRNAYFSLAADHSLIARLQDYRAGAVLGVPTFRMKEPWARFATAEEAPGR